jgi:biopolymer transport protein ExbB/TolQ
MLTKVGPSLGLLGTLIPMGSSLSQLSSGNLDAMSGQMVVAFTTAIIGLSTGTLAFALSVLRLRWVEQDLRELRYLAERLAAGKEA